MIIKDARVLSLTFIKRTGNYFYINTLKDKTIVTLPTKIRQYLSVMPCNLSVKCIIALICSCSTYEREEVESSRHLLLIVRNNQFLLNLTDMTRAITGKCLKGFYGDI